MLEQIALDKQKLSNGAQELLAQPRPKNTAEVDAQVAKAGDSVPDLKLIRPGDTVRETVDLDGQKRDFFLHIPKNYDASKPTALVMVFNGYSDKPGQGGAAAGGAGMEQITGMSQKADDKNFIVAYMDGNPNDKFSWNNKEWWFSGQDDLKLTKNVLASIKQDFNVDPARQYLSGFSQGGSFAHRVANEMPGQFAAIATVSTWMTGMEKPHSDNLSVLNIHSKDDPTVPFDGRIMGVTMKPQEHIYDHYAQLDGITQPAQASTFTGLNGSNVDVLRGVNEQTGAEVQQVFVHHEGHLWFGGFGDEKSAVNATDMVVDFLLSHPKREPGQNQSS